MTSSIVMPNPLLRGRFRSFPYLPLAVVIFMLARLFAFGGLTWLGYSILVVSFVWLGIDTTRWLFNMKYEIEENDPARQVVREEPDTLVSLVFFLEEPREVTEENLRRCVSHALNVDLDDTDADSEFFVVQYSPPTSGTSPIENYMVRIPQGVFSVMLSNRPYISNPVKFARDSIRDKRLRTAVEKHRAWISVDLMDDDIESTEEAYVVIGKLLGSMAGPDCLAIYCPEIQRCNEFEPSQIEVLLGGSPLSIFDEPTFEPVIEVSDNDPRMAAAEKTAQERWPEFVQAFENKKPADAEKFIVKAEFTEGTRSEFMWVTVTTIKEYTVNGILTNDPHELVEVFRGAEVEFPIERLNDWIYPGKDGTPIGGFTLDILSEDLD
ncbi:MAG: DUF2314 domain-containing protein [Verrucomicrobiales bacterium]|nr:DUF2314 domain-containing protein [Verrucomicrobiales bacterium]